MCSLHKLRAHAPIALNTSSLHSGHYSLGPLDAYLQLLLLLHKILKRYLQSNYSVEIILMLDWRIIYIYISTGFLLHNCAFIIIYLFIYCNNDVESVLT